VAAFLPLINSFNQTMAAIFLMQAVLPEGCPFYQLDIYRPFVENIIII